MTEEKNLSASATSSPPSGSDSAYNSLLQRYLNTVPCVKRKKERERQRKKEICLPAQRPIPITCTRRRVPEGFDQEIGAGGGLLDHRTSSCRCPLPPPPSHSKASGAKRLPLRVQRARTPPGIEAACRATGVLIRS